MVYCSSSAATCAIFTDSNWSTSSCATGARTGIDGVVAGAVWVATVCSEVGTAAVALDDLDDLVMVQWGRVIATVD